MECKAIIIEKLPDAVLLQEALAHIHVPFNIKYVYSIHQALQEISHETYDLILIGSGIIIQEGFEVFLKLTSIPTVIMAEGEGFEILLDVAINNICILTRPFDFEKIPELIDSIYKFWLSTDIKLK